MPIAMVCTAVNRLDRVSGILKKKEKNTCNSVITQLTLRDNGNVCIFPLEQAYMTVHLNVHILLSYTYACCGCRLVKDIYLYICMCLCVGI